MEPMWPTIESRTCHGGLAAHERAGKTPWPIERNVPAMNREQPRIVTVVSTVKQTASKKKRYRARLQRRLDLFGLQRIIPRMKVVDRILARTLVVLTALALVAPSASGLAGAPSVSGEAVCCTGMVADADSSQCGSVGAELPAGEPCAAGCSGAFLVYPPSCGASLQYAVPHLREARLTGHDAPPDPFPPKMPAAA